MRWSTKDRNLQTSKEDEEELQELEERQESERYEEIKKKEYEDNLQEKKKRNICGTMQIFNNSQPSPT